jgi:chromosomal replication initiator protein
MQNCPKCGHDLLAPVKTLVDIEKRKELVLNTVSDSLGIPIAIMTNCTRRREVVFARQISMIMLNHFTEMSLKSIGQIFNRDHTTVIHAKERLSDLCDTEPETKAIVDNIRDQISEAVI